MPVRIFVSDLAGGIPAQVKQRGDDIAVLLSPAAWAMLSMPTRVDLLNRLVTSQQQETGPLLELLVA